MLDLRSVRLVASVARNERLLSHSQVAGTRSFATNVCKPPGPRHLHHRPRHNVPRASCLQQTRSLSFFGWGSSKSSDPSPDFSKVHSTQSAGSPPQSVYEKWDAGTASSSPTPVKAVHATSDTPATSPLPHTPEPQLLREIENAIAAPHPAPGTQSLLPPEEALSAIPERIGYLKEVCGLDYGWGPTAILEFTVEHLHIYGGLTWAASIVSCALLIRVVAFRPVLQASNVGVRLKQANPALGPLRDEYKAASLEKDVVKQQQVGAQMRLLMKEYNISYTSLLIPLIIQVPLSFGAFRLFRGMSSLPVPAFEAEKWLWTSDLTQSDPLIVLPIVSAASLYMTLKLGSETGAAPMQGEIAKILKVMLPAFTFVFVYFQPGAVQLYFSTTSVLSLCQSALLRNASFRRWLQLLPLPPKVTTDSGSSGNTRPGGLKVWHDTKSDTATESQTVAPKNISVIDRYVDSAKGRYTNIKESVLGKTADREAARSKENIVSKAETYERSKRQLAEYEREQRNKSKKPVDTGKGVEDTVDELVEEDEERPRTTRSGGRKKGRSGRVRR